MIAIIDYDAGNLKSVEKALLRLGANPVVTREREVILQADHIILPGVGAFGDAMANLKKYGLDQIIQEAVARKIPLLGICLGLQLLFERSAEAPGVEGLGVLKGEILRIPDAEGLKIPHMGWNSLVFDHPGRLFKGIPENTYVYFVHSYYLKAQNPDIVKASTFYSTKIHASVEQENVFACQFHPEKSSDWGLKILDNFIRIGNDMEKNRVFEKNTVIEKNIIIEKNSEMENKTGTMSDCRLGEQDEKPESAGRGER